MPNQDILNYIKSESAQGQSAETITAALVANGWKQELINEAYQSLQGLNSKPSVHATEKDYPISLLWVFKGPAIMLIFMVIALLFGRIIPYLMIAFPIYLIANPLIRSRFHYSLEDKYFVINQGVFKKVQRNLPYGVIQNVFIKQDFVDRILGLSSLRIENAAGVGGQPQKARSFRLTGVGRDTDTVGSSGNKVNIPGLKKAHAETLRDLILQKMKENPLEDNQSGL